MRMKGKSSWTVALLIISLIMGCASTGPVVSGVRGVGGKEHPSDLSERRERKKAAGKLGKRSAGILREMEKVRTRLESQGASEDHSLVDDARMITAELPGHPYSWLLLGLANRVSGNTPAATDALVKALELDPEFDTAYLHLGTIVAEEGDFHDAEFFLDQAWKKFNNRDAALLLAYLKLLMGQPDSARDLLNSVAPDDSGDPEILNNLALALDLTGRDREARSLLENLPGGSARTSILETRALVELKEGRTNLAAADLEQRLALEDPDTVTTILMGILSLQKGNLKAAEEYFREATERSPSDPAGYLNLGLTLRRRGRFTEARSVYQDGILKADHPDIHLNLGVLHELYLNEPQKAAEQYRHFTRIEGGGSQRVGGWIDYLSGVTGDLGNPQEEGP